MAGGLVVDRVASLGLHSILEADYKAVLFLP